MRTTTTDASVGPMLAQTYLFVGLGAVVGLGVALLQIGAEPWAVLPALIGGAGLVFRWRLATLGVFLATTFALLAPRFLWGHFRDTRPPPTNVEMLLCASTLVYALAHYRLLALEIGLFSDEPLRPATEPPRWRKLGPFALGRIRSKPAPSLPRPIDVAAGRELPSALTAAAGATLAAFALWEATAAIRPPLGIKRPDWRVGQTIWVVTLILVAVTGIIGYFGWRRRSAAEAELYLRDVFWAETRQEQRRVGRWLAYGLRRRERRGRA